MKAQQVVLGLLFLFFLLPAFFISTFLFLNLFFLSPSKRKFYCNTVFRFLQFNCPLAIIRLLGFSKIQLLGTFPSSSAGSFIIVSNHRSLMDAALLSYAIPLDRNVIFFGRKDQQKIPFVGWAMMLFGHVFVDFKPGNKAVGSSVKVAMDQSASLLRSKSSPPTVLVVFAEGLMVTLFENYQGVMLPLKKGAFELSLENRIHVLPCVLKNSEALWEKPLPSATVRVQFAASLVTPTASSTVRDMMQVTENEMIQLLK